MRNLALGQALIAIAAAGVAAFSLVYGDFAPGSLSLPAWLPARQTCTAAFALLLLAASAATCLPRTAPAGAVAIAVYYAVWAAIPLPQVPTAPLSFGTWYPISEGLSALVGAWILYTLLRPRPDSLDGPLAANGSARAAQIVFGLSCAFYGASHFAYAEYTASMVPAWLPAPLGWAYFTGAGHVAAGIGLMLGILPRLAATLEALMMSLFGLLVWVPTFFMHPPPQWATPPQNQWSELAVNMVLAASAWMLAISLQNRPWGPASRA
jgi:uncharacterized membrane protein YphA (DoxX/SURF4 family)